jgi:D-alanyl-D-alanine carboxypeptidase/D-alanyl-D-alanine-endopeptidase (penicillin-binding protein 4)
MKFSYVCYLIIAILVASSCSVRKKIRKQAEANFITNSDFAPAHFGISIFDPAANEYLYNYQADKYFIPASNTKLFTCYAAMKYLGDSIVAGKYKVEDDAIILQSAGDPTFLHPDFKQQRLYNFLSQNWIKEVELSTPFATTALGRGWSWDDYSAAYMAERDPFPIYGNIATFTLEGNELKTIPQALKNAVVGEVTPNESWSVERSLAGRFYTIANGHGSSTNKTKTITMAMEKGAFATKYLSDTLHKQVTVAAGPLNTSELKKFYSQSTDSLLKITMHRSDNFFAEQLLLMVSNEKLGVMNDTKLIDTLLKTDYGNLPHKPKWVDGSGLSRYNLFTPQDFVWLLNKMQTEFGMERMKEILPTGGEGTLSSLYKNYSGRIYAKTGTLSNHVALSGFLFTKKNRTLIFSVLVNNQQAPAVNIRQSIEKFITSLIETY